MDSFRLESRTSCTRSCKSCDFGGVLPVLRGQDDCSVIKTEEKAASIVALFDVCCSPDCVKASSEGSEGQFTFADLDGTLFYEGFATSAQIDRFFLPVFHSPVCGIRVLTCPP